MKKKKSTLIKPPNISNLALMQEALEALQKETNFHFIDITFGNGYFLFTFEKNSVCHFHIKEIPGFRFALWNANNVNIEGFGPDYKGTELILFSQAEITLDKFKPSNSCLRAPLTRYTYFMKPDNGIFEWCCYDAANLLKYMKKHRLESYYKSNYSEWYVYDTISTFDLLYDYVYTRFRKIKELISTKIINKIICHKVINKLKNFNIKAMLIDHGECCSPRLDLNILLDKDISDDEFNKIEKVLDYFDENYFMKISIRCFDYSTENKKRYFKWLKYIKKEIKNEEEDYKILWEKI